MKSETRLLNTITVHIGNLTEKQLVAKCLLTWGRMEIRWLKQAIMKPRFSLPEKLPMIVDIKVGSINRDYSVFLQTCPSVAQRGVKEEVLERRGVVCLMLPGQHLVLRKVLQSVSFKPLPTSVPSCFL